MAARAPDNLIWAALVLGFDSGSGTMLVDRPVYQNSPRILARRSLARSITLSSNRSEIAEGPAVSNVSGTKTSASSGFEKQKTTKSLSSWRMK
jgi:hypothetical protein